MVVYYRCGGVTVFTEVTVKQRHVYHKVALLERWLYYTGGSIRDMAVSILFLFDLLAQSGYKWGHVPRGHRCMSCQEWL